MTPLVYNGVMYVVNPMSKDGAGGVQALDAVTGDLLWDYRHPLEAPPVFNGGNMRNLAIYGDKIFLATPDAHIVALNATTGKVAWDRTTADYKLGYAYTSGPIVVKGKVVAGIRGCDHFKVTGMTDVCFISALDAETGREVWRTSTVARPGEPGGDTWGDLPLIYRAGGDAWIPGSYDPQTNLIYWATAQPKPWGRVSRRLDGDALYTNTVLALDPDAGKIVWYNQLVPGESFDQDEVFENILIDYDGHSSLFKMGKLGILWELDRKTGKFRSGYDLGYQTQVELNRLTGKVCTVRASWKSKRRASPLSSALVLVASRTGGPWRTLRSRTRSTFREPPCASAARSRQSTRSNAAAATRFAPTPGKRRWRHSRIPPIPITAADSLRWTSRRGRFCGSIRRRLASAPRS